MLRYRSYFLFAVDVWKESHCHDAHHDIPHSFHNASAAKNPRRESELTLSAAIAQSALTFPDAPAAILAKKGGLDSDCAFAGATDKSWHVDVRAINPYEHSCLKL
jgi:hypothetical protein